MSEIPVLQGLWYIPLQLRYIELNQHQPAIVGINDGISGSINFVPTLSFLLIEFLNYLPD